MTKVVHIFTETIHHNLVGQQEPCYLYFSNPYWSLKYQSHSFFTMIWLELQHSPRVEKCEGLFLNNNVKALFVLMFLPPCRVLRTAMWKTPGFSIFSLQQLLNPFKNNSLFIARVKGEKRGWKVKRHQQLSGLRLLKKLLMLKCSMLFSGLVPELKQNFNKRHTEKKTNGMKSKELGNYGRNVYLKKKN